MGIEDDRRKPSRRRSAKPSTIISSSKPSDRHAILAESLDLASGCGRPNREEPPEETMAAPANHIEHTEGDNERLNPKPAEQNPVRPSDKHARSNSSDVARPSP